MLYPLSYVRPWSTEYRPGDTSRADLTAISVEPRTYPYRADDFWSNTMDSRMTQLLDLPLMGLDQDFPQSLFVLHHPATDRYGCFCHEGVHGLACFSSEMAACRFAEHIALSGMSTMEVTFDDARQRAKGRPLPVVSLMLLDKMAAPEIHYVR